MTTLRFARFRPDGTALALAGLALGFNLPFSLLASRFDYPGILRQPAEVILDRFAGGGPGLVAIWYGFALAALALVPVALLHALGGGRARAFPGLATAAAIAGALAGLTQAMGLLRWVLVVPGLAATGDVEGFRLIHAFGGTLAGEHMGQMLMGLHVALVAALQSRERQRRLAGLGGAVALLLAIGALEGPVQALGGMAAPFGQVAVFAYMGLTLWLLASAWAIQRGRA